MSQQIINVHDSLYKYVYHYEKGKQQYVGHFSFSLVVAHSLLEWCFLEVELVEV